MNVTRTWNWHNIAILQNSARSTSATYHHDIIFMLPNMPLNPVFYNSNIPWIERHVIYNFGNLRDPDMQVNFSDITAATAVALCSNANVLHPHKFHSSDLFLSWLQCQCCLFSSLVLEVCESSYLILISAQLFLFPNPCILIPPLLSLSFSSFTLPLIPRTQAKKKRKKRATKRSEWHQMIVRYEEVPLSHTWPEDHRHTSPAIQSSLWLLSGYISRKEKKRE